MVRQKRCIQAIAHAIATIVVLYFLICWALWRWQTRLMFFPSSHLKATPADVGLGYEDVWLTVNGGQVHGWWIPAAAGDSPVVLYLHGNASNLGDLVNRIKRFHRWGYGVWLIDYRGYGRSSGLFPNEQRVYEDAEAAWRYLVYQQRVPDQRIVLYGRSIGGAIALHLAAHHPDAAGVIVESTFTSMRAMADVQLPIPLLPVDYLLTQAFDSLAKARSLSPPILLIHGVADRTIPASMSQTLHEAVPSAKTLVLIEAAGHNDVPRVGGDRYADAVKGFIERYAD